MPASAYGIGDRSRGAGEHCERDPTNHFGTFTLTCGEHTLVIRNQPGASNVVTFDGEPSTSGSVLKGLTFSIDGEVVLEFHKQFVEHQDVTICTAGEAPGELLVVETLLTPRGH